MNTVATPERSFDPVWEDAIYGQGKHLNRWPFDSVVSFVFRNFPRSKPRIETRILEIGCGAGNNLWFCASEGFSVAGIDGSAAAIDFAKRRFADAGLQGDFQVGDFTALPFADDSFDLAIDRGSLTCCGRKAAQVAVNEVRRVLTPGGKFFCNPYSSEHTSATSGQPGPDDTVVDIAAGTLTGVGQLCFYDQRQVERLFDIGWQVESLSHVVCMQDTPIRQVHADWQIVAVKR